MSTTFGEFKKTFFFTGICESIGPPQTPQPRLRPQPSHVDQLLPELRAVTCTDQSWAVSTLNHPPMFHRSCCFKASQNNQEKPFIAFYTPYLYPTSLCGDTLYPAWCSSPVAGKGSRSLRKGRAGSNVAAMIFNFPEGRALSCNEFITCPNSSARKVQQERCCKLRYVSRKCVPDCQCWLIRRARADYIRSMSPNPLK